jgi:hypothetical protein
MKFEGDIHNDIIPAVNILLEVFPWLLTTSEEDFCMAHRQNALLFPAPDFDIRVTVENGQISLRTNMEWTKTTFISGDNTEAIGVISVAVQRWKKMPPFQRESFQLWKRGNGKPIKMGPAGTADALLMSPSGSTYRPYCFDDGHPPKPTRSFWSKVPRDGWWIADQELVKCTTSSIPLGMPVSVADFLP